MNQTVKERFDAKWIPEPNSGCWLWTGAISGIRPSFGVKSGRTDVAYRVSYKLHCGDIPDGLYVCHKCDVPMCVNPDHLFLGTQSDNLQDMAQKGRGHGPCNNRLLALYSSKLTEADIREIRASTEPSRKIALVYNVTPANIVAIRARKTWRHVQ